MTEFSIEINFGGKFVLRKGAQYVGGKNEVVDNCDGDLLSIIEIHDMLKEIGVLKWKELHYCVSGYGLKKGLRNLKTDEDVLAMVHSVNCKRYVKVYVEDVDNKDQVGEGSSIVCGEDEIPDNLAMVVFDEDVDNEKDVENFEDEDEDEDEYEYEDDDEEVDNDEDDGVDGDGEDHEVDDDGEDHEEDDGEDHEDDDGEDHEEDDGDVEQVHVNVNSYEEEGSDGSFDNAADSRELETPMSLKVVPMSLKRIE